MANGLFQPGGPFGPISPGLSPMLNPAMIAGFGLWQQQPVQALQTMGALQQGGQQLALQRDQFQAQQAQRAAAARQAAMDRANQIVALQSLAPIYGELRVPSTEAGEMLAPDDLARRRSQAANQFMSLAEADPEGASELVGEMLAPPDEQASEPLVNVLVDGVPTMVPRSQAAGMQAGYTPTPPEAPGTGVMAPKERVELAQKLRKEYTGQSKTFKEQVDAWGRLHAVEPTPAGDISLIFNYMKLLDPGSTVREGEFATIESAGNVSNQLRQQYNRLVSGERLTDEMRSDYLDQADNLMRQAYQSQEMIKGQYRGLATEAGVSPGSVVFPYMSQEDVTRMRAPQGGPAETGGNLVVDTDDEFDAIPEGAEFSDARDGKRYRKEGGLAVEL